MDGGKEKTLPSGRRTDILTEDEKGPVVVETKAGQADDATVVQTLVYMGEIAKSDRRLVCGIIIAEDFTPKVIDAARVSPNIRLLRYSVQFTFEAVGDGDGEGGA